LNVNHSFIAAAIFLVAWIVLAFVIAYPTGWVHAFLALAVIFITRGIVLGTGHPPT
jgi:uncharacterized membrane protein (DUF485 family)